jgi:hypothetical protein
MLWLVWLAVKLPPCAPCDPPHAKLIIWLRENVELLTLVNKFLALVSALLLLVHELLKRVRDNPIEAILVLAIIIGGGIWIAKKFVRKSENEKPRPRSARIRRSRPTR